MLKPVLFSWGLALLITSLSSGSLVYFVVLGTGFTVVSYLVSKYLVGE